MMPQARPTTTRSEEDRERDRADGWSASRVEQPGQIARGRTHPAGSLALIGANDERWEGLYLSTASSATATKRRAR